MLYPNKSDLFGTLGAGITISVYRGGIVCHRDGIFGLRDGIFAIY